MCAARREIEGELIAHLVRCIPTAVWAPDKLPGELNPWKAAQPESEAMRKHREAWARARWRAAVASNREG